MPSVDANLKAWDRLYGWEQEGDEWSSAWGGATAQWYGSILPRIRRFLPADSILEIAPGHGRWTHFLREHARQLSAVDLSASCIEFCRKRFDGDTRIRYFVNDGLSLEMIDAASVDFAFSFDSLVHVEEDVIRSYLVHLARVLKPDGAAFLHHSNLGGVRAARLVLKLKDRFSPRDGTDWIAAAPRGGPAEGPGAARRALGWAYELAARCGLVQNTFWRGRGVSMEHFASLAVDAGLCCIAQESANWYGRWPIDCMSTVTRAGSRHARANRVLVNTDFMREAALIRRRGPLYEAS